MLCPREAHFLLQHNRGKNSITSHVFQVSSSPTSPQLQNTLFLIWKILKAWFAHFTRGDDDIYLCSCCCCHGDCMVSLWYSIQPGSICIGQQLRADNKQITGGTMHVSRTLALHGFAGFQANVIVGYIGLLIVVTP